MSSWAQLGEDLPPPLGGAQLPNLTPLAPTDLVIDVADDYDQSPPYALRFTSKVLNVGDYALDLEGKDQGENRAALAMQCVKWVAYGACLERQAAGEFVFHPGHDHYHIADFGYFELRKLLEDRSPDYSAAGLAAASHKISSCVVDVERKQLKVGPWAATGNPAYATCGLVSQGISAGWADVYGYYLDGQQIIIDDVPDGDYALVARVNAANMLLETDYSDNTASILVTISEDGRQVSETV